jgi:hypothetical protein
MSNDKQKTTQARTRQQHLKRATLLICVKRMLEQDLELLHRLYAGRAYEPGLLAARQALESRLAQEGATDPDRARIAELSADQDALDADTWNEVDGICRNKRLPPAMTAAAGRVRTAVYGDKPPARRTSVAARGARAESLGRALPELRDDLAQLTTRIPGETVGDWLDRWCRLSSQLVELYSRPRAAARAVRGDGGLVARTAAFVRRMRHAVEDELAYRPDVPRETEAELFALWDRLIGAPVSKRKRSRPAASDAAPSPDAPQPVPAPAAP